MKDYEYVRVEAKSLNALLELRVAEGWEVHTINFVGQMANVLLVREKPEARQYLSDAVRAGVM